MTKKELNKIKELLEMDMKPEDITYLVKASYGEILKVANKKKMDTKRKIKFRAWDKLGKEMIFFGFEHWDHKFRRKDVNVFKEVEVMQYTGLKDKNGKEIYHFDFVKDEDGNEREIVYENGSFFGKWGLHTCPMYKKPMQEVEVVGNRYENR